jgi:hypothetical protein
MLDVVLAFKLNAIWPLLPIVVLNVAVALEE